MSEPTPELYVVGTSHAVAPAGMRERLHVDLDALYDTLRRLCAGRLLEEAVPVATCGRLELYLVTAHPRRALATLRRLVTEHTGVGTSDFASYTFVHQGPDAVRHLLRVASGLDSAVYGEAQVLGQVRDALGHPSTSETSGPWLQRLFQTALATGKRVRADTEIGRGAVSLAGAALGLLGREVGSLEGRTAVVLGAGDTGSLIARLLSKQGIGRLVIANRTVERARVIATAVGGEAHGLDDLPALLADADVIVGTVAEQEALVTVDALSEQEGRVRHLIDLAHPRNFDPALASVPGVRLMDLDHIFARVEEAKRSRAQQVPLAEAIVDEKADAYMSWVRSRGSTTVLRAIREEVLRIAGEEAERHGRGPEERRAMQRFARSFARTLLHRPTLAIRGADPRSPEGRTLVESAASLFGVGADGALHGENGDHGA